MEQEEDREKESERIKKSKLSKKTYLYTTSLADQSAKGGASGSNGGGSGPGTNSPGLEGTTGSENPKILSAMPAARARKFFSQLTDTKQLSNQNSAGQ